MPARKKKPVPKKPLPGRKPRPQKPGADRNARRRRAAKKRRWDRPVPKTIEEQALEALARDPMHEAALEARKKEIIDGLTKTLGQVLPGVEPLIGGPDALRSVVELGISALAKRVRDFGFK